MHLFHRVLFALADIVLGTAWDRSCGDTFERAAIEQWFQGNDTCPYCRELSTKVVMPNKAVKKMIQDWKP